jgi:predicted nucleotidyltransferase component of viral defense system
LIPLAFLQEWSAKAPWPDSRQVEQDLIISRALCDLFNAPALKDKIAFRGGTALNKLLFATPLRYSEDIDLVQLRAEPNGPIINAIRDALSWLGPCKRVQAAHSVHLTFRFAHEADPTRQLKLKVEVNTREHECFLGLKHYPFAVESRWYQGRTEIVSYEPEELFATKLRALLQRRKNRDLFDLNEGLTQLHLDLNKLLQCFEHYLQLEGNTITRATAEERMLQKLDRSLTEDIQPLLPVGIYFTKEDATRAFEAVWKQLVVHLNGDEWKLTEKVIAELRKTRLPDLLRERTDKHNSAS